MKLKNYRNSIRYACSLIITLSVFAIEKEPIYAEVSLPRELKEQLSPLEAAAEATTAIDIELAQKLLGKLDVRNPKVAFQRARLAMLEGNCDEALRFLSSDQVLSLSDESKLLFNTAYTCSRAMAGTIIETTPELIVRFQEEHDRVLMPMIHDTLFKQRDVLLRDLGVEMKLPLRVDVVRDQFSLSAMSGLPHQAAQKTGTVAIAKFGRVILLSPRAPRLGYAWRDTLAHELTHLALSRGTLDHAPLWLQEGVAKREETRWRALTPIDEFLPADTIAAKGLAKGLGRPLDAIGASIALLPSAKEAMVVFAEVTSFVSFISGDRANQPGASQDTTTLSRFIASLKQTSDVDKALKETTSKDLKAWNDIWRNWVMKQGEKPLPAALNLDSTNAKPMASTQVLQQQTLRIGELLLGRKHAQAARNRLDSLDHSLWEDPWINACVARARLDSGDAEGARPLVEMKSIHGHVGIWWAVRAEVLNALHLNHEDIYNAYQTAIAYEPFRTHIACSSSDFFQPSDNWLKTFVQGLCASARERNTPDFEQD